MADANELILHDDRTQTHEEGLAEAEETKKKFKKSSTVNSQPTNDKKSKKTEECDEEKKYKCFPREIREFFHDNRKKNGLLIYDRRVFDKFDWSEMKRLNIKENTHEEMDKKKDNITNVIFKNPPTIVLFPNIKGRAYIKGVIGETADSQKRIPFLVKVRDSTDPKDVVWLDEVIDKKKVMKILTNESFIMYIGVMNGQPAIFYSADEMPESIYDIEAVYMPIALSTNESTNIIADRYLITKKTAFFEDFSDVANKRFDNLYSISPVWDFDNDHFLYDEVETFIIMSATIFMIPKFPAINLIICGETHARKSAWLEMEEATHGDKVIAMQHQASAKGLLVSFYGDRPKIGVFFNSRYVCLADEFMRGMYKGGDNEGRIMALLKNCSEYMNILEKKPYLFSSGKSNLIATLKSSFIATDNSVFRTELATAYRKDPASFRRFAFLQVSKETEQRGYDMNHVSSEEAIVNMLNRFRANKSFDSLEERAKWMRFARNAIRTIKLTAEDNTAIKELMTKLKNKYHANFPLHDTARALLMCWKFWHEHLDCIDIKVFEDAIERIYKSHKELLEPDTTDWKKNITRGTSIDLTEKQLEINDDFSKA